MSVTYQREPVATVLAEGRTLFTAHYAEIGETFYGKPFALDESFFLAAEAAGAMRLFTARFDAQLIGYSAHAVTRHPLCDAKQAQQLVFIVAKSFRGSGVGRELLTFADAALAAEGVEFLFQNAALAPMAKMLERAGYKHIDNTYLRRL